MASTFLTRTIASATGTTKGTFSCWVKRSGLTDGRMFSSWGSGTSQFWIIFSSNKISIADYDGSYNLQYVTNRLFRDTSAWYHIVVAIDTTLGTSGDRVKLYVNGVQETSFSTSTAPSQDQVLNFSNNGEEFRIGKRDSEEYLDGSMTHIHFTDGYAYAASDFGETDSTSGIWKPKTSPSVTYGNNGFFLKMENSGAMGTDSSGNSNTFTVSGTLTQNVDTPSNNFATFNPLKDGRMNGATQYKATFTNGNTTSTFAESTYNTGAFSSLAVNSGKYYAEIKCSNAGGNTKLGLFSADDYGSNDFSGTYLYDSSGTFGGSAYGNSFTTGDIIQIAFDATNGTVWFGKNGTWQNSATQSEIEAGTTTNSATTGIDMTQFWHFGTYGVNATAFQANFGQGYFGTTAVATNSGSGYQDSDGNGKMNYSVPSGYKILCTKGINSF